MTSETALQALYDRLRKRESEQLKQLALSQKMATISTHKAFEALQPDLQNFLGQDNLYIFVADKEEKSYSLILQVKRHTQVINNDLWSCKAGFFQHCIDSAEPVQHGPKEILKAESTFPTILVEAVRSGSKAIISMAFRMHDQRWAILSLEYKKRTDNDLQLINRITSLIPQLNITIGNIRMNTQSVQLTTSKILASPIVSSAPVRTDFTTPEVLRTQIIGNSEQIKIIKSQLETVASTEMTLLIQGESGTGKEVVAQYLHRLSTRSQQSLIKINCAAIAPTLIESELFGHEKGSFSGAIKRKIGKFEQANGGTLFLDEIGDLPLVLQAKLLRVLQEKEVERVGGNKIIPVDVRIICATHKDLQAEVRAGNFRADLYYRISAFPVTLPPLRERREDIPILVQHFLEKHAGKVPPKQMGKKMLQHLGLHPWPGNIRELEHVVARAILLTEGPTIKNIMLSDNPVFVGANKIPDFSPQTLADFEKQYILWVLRRCNGLISGTNGAATILGIPATTLQSKMKKLGISKKFISLKE
ncbi:MULTISPECIES: sigma-54 interaction domain-containing protein [Sphingobacterium]|uniref:sigma-54 interaction domain-containing protein n=1 Tax=Sphingobacterium TaxID=28453 RepID=UPI0025802FAD|nr:MULTISPECIES: sigma-54 dependent transcriptional regulator [Sphingobacterium]